MDDVVFDDVVVPPMRSERIVIRTAPWRPYVIFGIGISVLALCSIAYIFRLQPPTETLQEQRFREWLNQGNTGAPPDYFMPE